MGYSPMRRRTCFSWLHDHHEGPHGCNHLADSFGPQRRDTAAGGIYCFCVFVSFLLCVFSSGYKTISLAAITPLEPLLHACHITQDEKGGMRISISAAKRRADHTPCITCSCYRMPAHFTLGWNSPPPTPFQCGPPGPPWRE